TGERQGLVDRVVMSRLHLLGKQLLTLRHARHGQRPSTLRPMLRALPAMVFTAASRSAALRSGILIFAMSSSCLRDTVPTFFMLGSPLPFGTPTAFFSSTAAGGVLVTKVKLRSL